MAVVCPPAAPHSVSPFRPSGPLERSGTHLDCKVRGRGLPFLSCVGEGHVREPRGWGPIPWFRRGAFGCPRMFCREEEHVASGDGSLDTGSSQDCPPSADSKEGAGDSVVCRLQTDCLADICSAVLCARPPGKTDMVAAATRHVAKSQMADRLASRRPLSLYVYQHVTGTLNDELFSSGQSNGSANHCSTQSTPPAGYTVP